jgi:hypothetical protein
MLYSVHGKENDLQKAQLGTNTDGRKMRCLQRPKGNCQNVVKKTQLTGNRNRAILFSLVGPVARINRIPLTV